MNSYLTSETLLNIKEALFGLHCLTSPFDYFPENPINHSCYNPLVDAAFLLPIPSDSKYSAFLRDYPLETSHRFTQPTWLRCYMRHAAGMMFDLILSISSSPKHGIISYENRYKDEYLHSLYSYDVILSKMHRSVAFVEEILSIWQASLLWQIYKIENSSSSLNPEKMLVTALNKLEDKHKGITDIFDRFWDISKKLGIPNSFVLFFYALNGPIPHSSFLALSNFDKTSRPKKDEIDKLVSTFPINKYPFSPKLRFEIAISSLEKYFDQHHVDLNKLKQNRFIPLACKIIPDFEDVFHYCKKSRICASRLIATVSENHLIGVTEMLHLSILICREFGGPMPLDFCYNTDKYIRRGVDLPYFVYGPRKFADQSYAKFRIANNRMAFFSLPVLESLRQQIFQAKGFFCPLFNPEEDSPCFDKINKCPYKTVFLNLIKKVSYKVINILPCLS